MIAMSKVLAEQQVREYAQTVAQALGLRAEQFETGVAPAPCQGRNGELAQDGRYYMQGNYQLPVPAGSHPQVLAQLRDLWERMGYQIREFRMFNATEGTVAAENPVDQTQISVESTRPATALALLILTSCYREADA